MLPGETYLNKIQTFLLHSRDGVRYSGPHYVLPGTGAHEYDATKVPPPPPVPPALRSGHVSPTIRPSGKPVQQKGPSGGGTRFSPLTASGSPDAGNRLQI